MEIVLEIRNLSKSFNGLTVLDNIHFSLEKSSINALIGTNGSGKSTLFNIISGFIKSDSGEIMYKKRRITSLPSYKISRKGLNRTFQLLRIFPQLSVLDNMLIALENRKKEKLSYACDVFAKYNSTRITDSATKLLSSCGLETKLDMNASNLSHGQKRILEIMRVIALKGDVLLFDEPSVGLSKQLIDVLFEIFEKLKKEGKTICFIEHNVDLAKRAERIIVLDNGKIIADGKPSIVLQMPNVISAYYGKNCV